MPAVPVPVTLVPVDDVRLAYREYGTGYPVLFISGLGATMAMWNPPVLERISRQFRAIVFDNRGIGRSGGSDTPLSIPLLARDAALLMDALGIPSAHVIGHSMGASIAQELALGFPGHVNRLVLVSATCGGAEAVPMHPATMARLTDKSGTAREVTDRMYSLLFPPAWRALHDPDRYCPVVDEVPGNEIVARQEAAFSAWEGSFSRLRKIRQPVLLVSGTYDEIVPPENSRTLRDRIPGSQFVEVPGAGHGLMYQCPERFCDHVLAFLGQ